MKRVLVAILLLILIVSTTSLFACKKTQEIIPPQKSQEAQNVLDYLAQANGKYVLSGQEESTWVEPLFCEYEMEYIKDTTGKYPAIRGMDYINDDFEGVNKRAIEWWNRGGIVSICWHTGVDYSGGYNECKEGVVTNWDALLEEGTNEYNAMIEGIDKAAKALKELKDLNIPIIWRPYHEAFGDWFWWGKGEDNSQRAEHYVKLWRIMYTRYIEYWKLDNLIWIEGYSHMDYEWQEKKYKCGVGADKWYVGSNYCDMIGADTYKDGTHLLLNDKIKGLNKAKKPTAYHECGIIPTIDELKKTNWSYFLTWHTNYLIDGYNLYDTDYKNTKEHLIEIYNSDYVITLDELPNFKI